MIEFVDVSKHFGTQDILDDVSFRVLAGERVGVVGPNGSGKSTLFALMQGDVSPDRGEVKIPKQTRLGHVRQQLNAHEVNATVLAYTTDAVPRLRELHREMELLEERMTEADTAARDKMLKRLGDLQHDYEHLGGYEMRTRAESALTGLGFSDDAVGEPFASLSGGWQMRAELARTLIAQPDMLLLDEPSNYLDLPAVEWLQRFLREFSGTMLLISHDRYLLESLTQVTVEVADGQVTRYQGGYSYYRRERAARYEQLLAAKKNQDRKREHIESFVERFRAKNTKASQVRSRLKALDKMETIKVSLSRQSHAPIQVPAAPHSGAEVLRLEGVGVGYEEKQWVVRGVDLSLKRGDKLALVGYNGMGKTTLQRVLAGALAPQEGRRVLGHKVVVGYQSQEFAETMPPDQTVYDITRAATPEADVSRVRSILGSFGFSGDAVDKPCRVLSGGEKIRLAFARIFVQPPNLLILDEPTTHLDLRGRETLEEALSLFTGTICLVSHDVAFVRNVATSILSITPAGVNRYEGGYEYYLEKAGEGGPASGNIRPVPHVDRKAAKRARAERTQSLNRKKRQLEKTAHVAERLIEKLEAEREGLVAELGQDPEGGTVDFAALNRRLTDIEQEIKAATEAWENAALELEQMDVLDQV